MFTSAREDPSWFYFIVFINGPLLWRLYGVLYVKTWKSRNKFQHEGNEMNQLSLTFHLTNMFPLSSSLRMTDRYERDGDGSRRPFLKANLCVLKRNKKIRFLTSVNFGNTFYTYLRIKTTDKTQIRLVIYLTNRFHVAVRLFSNRSQKKKQRSGTRAAGVLCDLLLNRPTPTWNLFVLYNDQKRK